MNVEEIIKPLVEFRKSIGAYIINTNIAYKHNEITAKELKILQSDGIDIDLQDIEIYDDKTFIYKGCRVILYIRDVNFYHSDWGLPKFHICKCSTYEQMVRSNRKYRYVVASREDGIFVINKGYGKKNWQQSNEKLEVCKNCLKAIYWHGEFSLKKFFAKYPKNILNVNGHLKDNIAPLNDYPDNWNEISAKIRAEANYICASCGKNFKNIPGFLHVHHKNGLKYDISRENLVVLCENCHSKQPYHSHMIIHK